MDIEQCTQVKCNTIQMETVANSCMSIACGHTKSQLTINRPNVILKNNFMISITRATMVPAPLQFLFIICIFAIKMIMCIIQMKSQ